MQRHGIFSSLISCLLVSVCVVAIPLRRDFHLQRPAAVRTAHHPHPVAFPAGLVPAVAQAFARHLPGTWQAKRTAQGAEFTNPVQHLALRLDNQGLLLTANTHDTVTWQLIRYTQGNQPIAFNPEATPEFHGARLSFARGKDLTEWYLNGPFGIEQGFTLTSPAHMVSSVTLTFKLNGSLTAVMKKNGLEFQNHTGKSVLRYGSLFVYDADHHPLPAHLRLAADRLAIYVDTLGARYPVTVDPLFSIVTTLPDPVTTSQDLFGTSVALSADGSIALIGAYDTKNYDGAAYVFTAINGVWSTTPLASFADPTATTKDYFGTSVALSADGSIALIGANGTKNFDGAAYVFTAINGVWSTTPVANFADPAASSEDFFGTSVALSGDGNTALIGADGTASGTGQAYVFTATGGTWSTTPIAKIADPAASINDAFGASVALSEDGGTALIGAWGTALSAGAAYIFTATGGIWSTTSVASFADPMATGNDQFGNSVALSADGSVALIGASETAVGLGTAYVFTASNGNWSTKPVASFTDPAASPGDFFGNSAALSGDGNTALIGASGTAKDFGKAYMFIRTAGVWSTTPVSITDPNPQGGAFGSSVSLSVDGATSLIGANETANAAGATYVFTSPVDLSLALSSDPGSVMVGETIDYMLTVTNKDTQVTATNLTLTDTLPVGTTFVSTTAAGGSCNNNSSTVTCTLASLAPQTTWQPSITVTATTAGSIKDAASINGSQPDTNSANNSATATTTVDNPASSSSSPSGSGGGAFDGLMLILLLGTLLWRRRS
ncbi:MAG: hypothetical protein WCC11_05460 [Gammaproteobacteria bacterium]